MSQSNESKKRGLGRGLGALIVNTEESANPMSPDVAAQAEAGGVRLLPLDRIAPNPHQPRTNFDDGLLAELAASIREHGIIQPLIVTAAQDAAGDYWIVAGERRWRAARLAGLTETPAIVREASPRQLMEWALVENVQRADLNALEEAAAYQTLMQTFELTQADVARRVGKSRPAIANTVRLLQLPQSVQTAVINATLSPGHARALLALEEDDLIEEAAIQVEQRGLNVRQTEELVRRMLSAPAEADQDGVAETQAAQSTHLESRFRSALGTRVNLTRNPDGSGRLIVHFYGDEDLQHLYQRMVGDEEL